MFVGFVNLGAQDSGSGTSTLTLSSKSKDDPHMVLFVQWHNGTAAAKSLSTITWNGNSGSIIVQRNQFGSSSTIGGAIVYIAGPQSGNIVLTFSGSIATATVRAAGLIGLQSSTAVDTDSDGHNSGGGTTSTLTALTNAGNQGIVLVFYVNDDQTTSITPTNVGVTQTEGDSGTNTRHLIGYDEGIPAGNYTCVGGDHNQVMLGASFR
jgi:hypothetical protein